MTIRDLHRADGPQLVEFLKRDFPEEERILGSRPEGVAEITRRVFRWDARLVLGLLRLFGRPVFRFFVIEENGRIIATTLLAFAGPTAYISTVAVDPAYRRRGLARRLLESSRAAAARRGSTYLALDVLASNAPARALYESIGYRALRSNMQMVCDLPNGVAPAAPPVAGLRPFDRKDAPALARLSQEGKPTEVEKVLPTSAREIAGSAVVGRMLTTVSAAWVIDSGGGPVAWVAAASSPATEAAHLSNPIIAPSVGPEAARGLVATALTWCAARRAPRVASMVPGENRRGHEALLAAGFRDAFPLFTLYRETA